MGPRLRRLELAGGSSACELSERGTAFMWQLRGLTSLDLEDCLGGCEMQNKKRLFAVGLLRLGACCLFCGSRAAGPACAWRTAWWVVKCASGWCGLCALLCTLGAAFGAGFGGAVALWTKATFVCPWLIPVPRLL